MSVLATERPTPRVGALQGLRRRLERAAFDWRGQLRPMLWVVAGFLGLYFLPVEAARFQAGVHEALALTRWYAREHVLLCLVPAFFIAGGISVFVRQGAVLRYLGPRAPKPVAYGVASVSGSLLAVCSCTILPLFGGIYRNGAGLGPAAAFLYSGPAINVLAVILTARILGAQIGLARAVGAVLFAVVIGVLMHLLFRNEEEARADAWVEPPADGHQRPLWQSAGFFLALTGILVFANWGAPANGEGLWARVHELRGWTTGGFALLLAWALWRWYGVAGGEVLVAVAATALAALAVPGQPLVPFTVGVVAVSLIAGTSEGEVGEWFASSWEFARLILPLLLLGVLLAGFLLGRPGHEGMIPAGWVASAVGGNGLGANLFAAASGALMYFATLTEVPILQGLMGAGMGDGPALALLLAGPAVSLPSLLVIRSILGGRRTAAFAVLVIVMATITGWLYGAFVG